MSDLVKSVELRITSDDGDTEAKLEAISLKADELSEKHPDLKVRIETAAASAKLAVLKAELRDLGKGTVAGDGKDGILGQALLGSDGIEGLERDIRSTGLSADEATIAAAASMDEYRNKIAEAAAAAMALEHEIDGVRDKTVEADAAADGGAGGGGLIGLIGKMGESLPSGGMLAGIAILIPLLQAAMVEATGLVSGLAAAGAGVGAFAILAIPALDKVKNAYSGISAAQKAYRTAVETEKLDPTKANAAAVTTALVKLKESWQGLDPAERGAVRGLQGLSAEYHRMALAFEPDAFKVFNAGLRVANNLLPTLKPFADSAATAIDGLLGKLAKFTAPTQLPFKPGQGPDPLLPAAPQSGWEKFLDAFRKLEGPSITAIGAGLGRVGAALGNLLTIMSKKDVVNSINIAFTILTGTIDTIAAGVSRLMRNWDQMSKFFGSTLPHAFDVARHGIAAFGDAVGHAVDAGGRFLERFSVDLTNWEGDAATAIGKVITWFTRLPGRIGAQLASLAGKLFSIGESAIDGLIRGIESKFDSVRHTIASLADLIPSGISKILSIFSPSRVTFVHGQMVALGLIGGMDSMGSQVSAAAARMAAAAIPGMPGMIPWTRPGRVTVSHGRRDYGGTVQATAPGQRPGNGVEARLDMIINLLRQAPAATSNGIEAALSGAGRRAVARGQYPSRGAGWI